MTGTSSFLPDVHMTAALAGIVSLMLAGCGAMGVDTAGLSGSASLRIDVEVYKGPLSKEEIIQNAELKGMLEEGRVTFTGLTRDAEVSMVRLGCTAHIPDIPVREPFDARYKICDILQRLAMDASETARKLALLLDEWNDDSKSETPRSLYGRIAEVGSWLLQRADTWSREHASKSPRDIRVRVEMANFGQYASRYGNELGARADALEKQLNGVGGYQLLRDQLASSVYLRNAGATRYLTVFDHNAAAVDRPGQTATDRVRMVEQLVDDTHWSKINNVFAAGQGEVRMAFIKDDIGNWNLKNFDNNPSELVRAYRQSGLALVSAVAEAAKLGSASNLLTFANNVALGTRPAADVTETISALHEQTAAELKAIGDSQQGRLKKLDEAIRAAEQEVAAQQRVLEPLTQDTSRAAESDEQARMHLARVQARIRELEGRSPSVVAPASNSETEPSDAERREAPNTGADAAGVPAAALEPPPPGNTYSDEVDAGPMAGGAAPHANPETVPTGALVPSLPESSHTGSMAPVAEAPSSLPPEHEAELVELRREEELARAQKQVTELKLEAARTAQAGEQAKLDQINAKLAGLKHEKDRLLPETVQMMRNALRHHEGVMNAIARSAPGSSSKFDNVPLRPTPWYIE